MKKVLFKGVGTAIATPFGSNGVNLSAFKKLLDFQLSNSIDSIVVCGTTGEAATMSDDEKSSVISCAVDFVADRVPVIAGCGSNDTSKAISNAKLAESLGVDGLLIVTPYYNKCTQSGLISHYSKIAESVSIPIILYNVPSRTGVNIEPETCLELSKIPNIVAIKEASGNISQVAKIAALCKDNLFIYSGNDDQVLPICLWAVLVLFRFCLILSLWRLIIWLLLFWMVIWLILKICSWIYCLLFLLFFVRLILFLLNMLLMFWVLILVCLDFLFVSFLLKIRRFWIIY